MSAAVEREAVAASHFFMQCRAALERLDAVSKVAVIAAMAGMAGLVIAQVVSRYALAHSIDWAEEVARLAFVWAMFLAIPHGIRSGIHVGIDVVVIRLPEAWQEALFRLAAVLGGILMAVILAYSWEVTVYTWPELMPTLDVTASVYYIAVLVSAVHSALHLALLAWGGRATWEESRP